MTLEESLGAKWIYEEDLHPDRIRRLLRIADRELADSHVPGISDEGSYEHAYTAALNAAHAALLAAGYDVGRGANAHYYIIQDLPETAGVTDEQRDYLDTCRGRRHKLVYDDDDVVTTDETKEFRQFVADFVPAVRALIATNHPELL